MTVKTAGRLLADTPLVLKQPAQVNQPEAVAFQHACLVGQEQYFPLKALPWQALIARTLLHAGLGLRQPQMCNVSRSSKTHASGLM